MQKLVSIILLLLLLACGQSFKQHDIEKINGYWEIEKVVLPDGEEKDFTINTTYDYFEIQDNKGYRRKGTPRFDGKFEGNDVVETVSIELSDGKAHIHYTTSFMKWTERIKSISDEKLVLINDEKKEYHYKRTSPINLYGDGETAQ